MRNGYDRAAEDLGNIVALEHVNTRIPDQQLATAFYVSGLGLTRDPYLMTGTDNMWVNVGRSQFHLPSSKPQVLRGCVGIVIPGREALLARLARARRALDGTRFGFSEHEGFVEACGDVMCSSVAQQRGKLRQVGNAGDPRHGFRSSEKWNDRSLDRIHLSWSRMRHRGDPKVLKLAPEPVLELL